MKALRFLDGMFFIKESYPLLECRHILKVSSMFLPYNHEHFVCDALNSNLNWTFQYFEVIASDNCSTDGSVAITERI